MIYVIDSNISKAMITTQSSSARYPRVTLAYLHFGSGMSLHVVAFFPAVAIMKTA